MAKLKKKKKIVKRPPRTIKERKFVKEYLKSGNATDAAAKVYDVTSRESAGVIGAQNLGKLRFTDVLSKAGVTDEKLAQVLDEGLRSTKRDKDELVPDRAVRHRYLETGLKMRGHSQDNAITINVQSNVLNLPVKEALTPPIDKPIVSKDPK